jgi:exopolysaccharide production protein ExoQ
MKAICHEDFGPSSGVKGHVICALLLVAIFWAFNVPFSILRPVSQVSSFNAEQLRSDAQMLTRVRLVVCFLAVLVTYFLSPKTVSTAFRTHWLLFAYFCLALASATWSVDPWATQREAILFGAALAGMACTIQVLGAAKVSRVLSYYLFLVCLVSMFFAVFFPILGTHSAADPYSDARAFNGAWRGVFSHKNVFGPIAGYSVLMAINIRPQDRREAAYRFMFFSIAITCLIMSRSTTNIGAAAIGVAFYVLIAVIRPSSALVMSSLALVIAPICIVLSLIWADVADAIGLDLTLTGRLQIWSAVLERSADFPVLGLGFSASKAYIAPILMRTIGPHAVDPHNNYLEILLDLGIIGISFFCYIVLSVFISGLRELDFATGATRNDLTRWMCIMVYSFVLAITEGAPFVMVTTSGTFFFGAIIMVQGIVSGGATCRS